MVKVLHILEATLGGTRKHVFDILRYIDINLFDVTFCYSTNRADRNFLVELEEIKQRGIRCIEIPMFREISLLKDVRSIIAIYRYIKKERFEIVHTHSSKAGFLGRVAAKLVSRKIKTVYTPNSMAINISPLYKYIEKFAGFFTNIIIAVSKSEKAEIIGARLKTKVEAINSGVKVFSTKQKKYNLHNELGLDEDTLVIASIGRLTRQKDPITYFLAIKYFTVLQQSQKVHFVWIGDGELRSEVEKYINSNSLFGYSTILGWRTDVEELLWNVDIFVLTSIYESFGYVTCEAMSHFLPVIATNVVGTTDIVIDGESGFLVEKGDARAIANKLSILCQDKQLRIRMGEKGQRIIQDHFNVLSMVIQTQDMYKGLLKT